MTHLEQLKIGLSGYGAVEIQRITQTKFRLKLRLFSRYDIGEPICDKLSRYFSMLGLYPTIGIVKDHITCEWEVRV